MDGLEIRLLSDADADEFWKVRLRALKEEPTAFGSAYEESVDTPRADIAKRLQNSDSSFVFGAFNPGLVGVVGFFRREGIKRRHKGHIWGMYVAPEGRGKGLGRALMQAAVKHARTLPDIEQLLLTVTNDSARQLYLSLGFVSYGLEPSALKAGDDYLDEHSMFLQLNRQ